MSNLFCFFFLDKKRYLVRLSFVYLSLILSMNQVERLHFWYPRMDWIVSANDLRQHLGRHGWATCRETCMCGFGWGPQYIIVLCVGSCNLSEIVMAQKQKWFGIPMFPVLVMFFVSCLAETNWASFDLPEAEWWFFYNHQCWDILQLLVGIVRFFHCFMIIIRMLSFSSTVMQLLSPGTRNKFFKDFPTATSSSRIKKVNNYSVFTSYNLTFIKYQFSTFSWDRL